MSLTLQFKRDTAANWTSNNPTLAAGEFGYETDTGKFKVGDGSTAWSSLGYFEEDTGGGGSPTPSAYAYQGDANGFLAGGANTPPFTRYSNILKYYFASDAGGTCVGNLASSQSFGTGITGKVDGVGISVGGSYPSPTSFTTRMYCFPFASEGVSSLIPFTMNSVTGNVNQGNASETHGYTTGGGPAGSTAIQKFPFSLDANASCIGALSVNSFLTANHSSLTNGYAAGTAAPYSSSSTCIQKFPFSSDTSASAYGGVLTAARQQTGGFNSAEDGYTVGGNPAGPTVINVVDKYPFASEANATDVGDMITAAARHYSSSGTVAGVTYMGRINPPAGFCSSYFGEYRFYASDASAVRFWSFNPATCRRYGGGSFHC